MINPHKKLFTKCGLKEISPGKAPVVYKPKLKNQRLSDSRTALSAQQQKDFPYTKRITPKLLLMLGWKQTKKDTYVPVVRSTRFKFMITQHAGYHPVIHVGLAGGYDAK